MIYLLEIFSISHSVFLTRGKRQNFMKKTWISRLDLHLINFD